MENITRTVYSSYLQTCLALKKNFVAVANTTLNQKFGIQNGVDPAPGQMPGLAYWGIGNAGHSLSLDANGAPVTNVVQHRGTDAALFNHLPFVLRELNNDLSSVERARYALRRIEEHGGRNYFAYYLRRLDLAATAVNMEYTTVVDNVSTTTPFVPDSSNLNPTAPVLNNNGVNVVSGDYTSVTSPVTLSISAADAAELLNVALVIYNDERRAWVSEICLCSGVDKVVQSPGVGAGTIDFNEAIAVQVMTHIAASYQMKFNNNGFQINLDVGATEPLFVLES
jgi:hypothetical protein